MLCNVKLIAEPWDIGDGGYQVGAFPNGWSEWNDIYRQTLRRFWRGDDNVAGDLAHCMTGSSVQFQHDGRSPRSSINHVTVHDGFTLEDLVSYEHKHNEANGEDNRDGSDDNLSVNCGVEGATDDPAILAMRRRRKRNQLACLFLAQGVPLLLAGDEVGNSQNGNNNAYCQDNEIGWVDWSKAGSEDDLTALDRRTDPAAPRFSPAQAAPLAGWPEGGRLLRREMADAAGRRDDGSRLEFAARALPVLRAGGAARRRQAAVRRAQPHRHAGRNHLSGVAGRDRAGAACSTPRTGRSMRSRCRPAPTGARTCAACWPSRASRERATALRSAASDRGVTFRLWAPAAREVSLVLDQPLAMPGTDGWFELHVAEAGPGTRYRFRIDGEIEIPDPASHFQPDDVHGPSEVIDHAAIQWQADGLEGPAMGAARCSSEAHVGTFTREGTFRAMIERLDHLAETGITALELMPVADFPGRWNWGYDGVLLFAPDCAYGRPEDLKALIDAAHARGLMVFLDVVYNHFGPEGNYLHRIAPRFFSDEHHTPWGAAIDYRVPEVRAFAIENALHWLRDYRFDGLRLDAVHAIVEPGEPHILTELATAVNAFAAQSGRHIHLVLENDDNAARFLRHAEAAGGSIARSGTTTITTPGTCC